MKKFSKPKLLGVVLALAVAASVTVSPTIAWLSASTTPVINYFSGGAIRLKLDEAPVDSDGKAISGDRVKENNYKYMAGAVLDKDPTVTVTSNSEDCYVYVCVDNELPDTLFTLDTNTTEWEMVSTSGTMTIYRYYKIVESSTSDQSLEPIFTTVTVSAALTSTDIADLGTKTLSVTAFAIQSDSLAQADADDMAEDYFYNGVSLSAILSAANQATNPTTAATDPTTATATTDPTATAATTDPTTASTDPTATTATTDPTTTTAATDPTATTAATDPASTAATTSPTTATQPTTSPTASTQATTAATNSSDPT